MIDALRVAARFQRRMAEQLAGQRAKLRRLTQPINKAKGISKDVLNDHGAPMDTNRDEYAEPHSRDIRPEDVFAKTPNQVAVLNLYNTGKDMDKALNTQVPKDKGHDTVNNLSQYLIRTEGGGGTDPEGRS